MFHTTDTSFLSKREYSSFKCFGNICRLVNKEQKLLIVIENREVQECWLLIYFGALLYQL